MQLQDDMFTQFLGGKPHRTRALERHAPPPYLREGEFEKLPVYTACPCPGADDESKTLTRYLFVYGFCTFVVTTYITRHDTDEFPSVFPLFWIVGVAIIFSPLRPAPEWETGKSEEERRRLLAEMRVSELKWAKRCLYAVVALLVLIVVLVTTLVLVRR
jgi:peptidoglycan/LPS O-acetylase OafA/YrhL